MRAAALEHTDFLKVIPRVFHLRSKIPQVKRETAGRCSCAVKEEIMSLRARHEEPTSKNHRLRSLQLR